MTLLPNPAESPCFGCGPGHARGLRLGFERVRADDGVEEVRCTYMPRADECGWPGFLHIGLHFLVMYEASYWGAWELSGKVAVTKGPATFDQQRVPRVGKPFVARARIADRDDAGLRMTCVSEGLDGKHLARLDTPWTHPSRAQVEKSGPPLPGYLLEDMAP